MREKILLTLARFQAKHPWRVMAIFALFTVIFIYFASNLKTTMRWSDLLPKDDPRTVEFDNIIKDFSSASNMVVVIQGKEDEIKKFADEIDPIISQVKSKNGERLIKRIDYKQEIDFLKNHAFMIMKKSDLEDSKDMFFSPFLDDFTQNLNNSLEKEYVGKEESISTREKQDQAILAIDGMKVWLESLYGYASGKISNEDKIKSGIDKLLLGDPYFISYDKSTLIMNVVPTFSIMDLDKVIDATNKIENLVEEKAKMYPGIKVGLTGFIPLARDEMVTSQESLNVTGTLSIIGIFTIIAIAFRMIVAPLFAILTLILGVLWASGVACITVGMLNIMTSMFAIILMGLGIDFSIHIISSFTEARSRGESIYDSLVFMYKKSGSGIITGALTTAVAFFCLTIAHSRGMKEMGIVSSTGLLAILVVTFLLLPTLFVLREKRREKKGKIVKVRDVRFKALGSFAGKISKKPVISLICFLVITGIMLYLALNIKFDYNYLNMEAKGLESIALQDTVLKKFDLSTDYALITAMSIDESRKFAKAAKSLQSIATVEDISLYLPDPSEVDSKIAIIDHIQESLEKNWRKRKNHKFYMNKFNSELERLKLNVMEIQDMAYLQGQDRLEKKCAEIVGYAGSDNSFIDKMIKDLKENKIKYIPRLTEYHSIFSSYFYSLVRIFSNKEVIDLNDLPQSIIERYANKNRTRFLVTLYPKENVWANTRFMEKFTKDVESVSPRATGMVPAMWALIQIVGRDGRNAAILTLFIVIIILVLDFRKVSYALLAIVPLLAGLLWMIGLMNIFGLMLTVVNIMGLPMILGIGIDNGVHIIHRFRGEEKGDVFTIFSSTGRAILLSSLTTMLAFGMLIFSIYRGFGSLGSAMAIGVGACFLTTLFFFSPVLKILGRRKDHNS